jgi:hypothetical protein
MRLRVAVPLAAALAAAVLVTPASAGNATIQVNVFETGSSCQVTLKAVSATKRLVLFHFVNNSTIPRGIIVWGVHSAVVQPKLEGDLYVKFPGPGSYPMACVAGSYSHPTITGRGIFRIGAGGVVRILPAQGGNRGGFMVV